MAKVKEFDEIASHASWMENFPWTPLPGVAPRPSASRWSISNACTAVDPAEKKKC